MTGLPISPRLVKGGIVTMDPDTSAVKSIIALQYNPDSLRARCRFRRCRAAQDGTRVDALRLRGPAVETIKIDAELDATDQLEHPDAVSARGATRLASAAGAVGDAGQSDGRDTDVRRRMANAGSLEIIPLEQPLTLFVWSKMRVVPVRLTDFSVTEEAFDPKLNPIRAKVSLGMRVLSIDDLGFSHPGGRMFMSYLTNKEQLASQATSVALSVLGLGGLP